MSLPQFLTLPLGRVLPVAVATLILGGCTGWRTQSVPLPEYLNTENPSVIRVTRADDTKIPLYDPKIVGNGLQGLPTERAITGITIPLSDVRSVATKHRSWTKTFLVGLAVVGGIFVWDALQSLNGNAIQ